MIDVLGTGAFEDWYMELSSKDAGAVTRVVGLLEERGVALGFPYSSDIKGSSVLGDWRTQNPIRQTGASGFRRFRSVAKSGAPSWRRQDRR